jgi:hypothetical protein
VDKFNRLLQEASQKSELAVEIKKNWRGILVKFGNGRHQRVKVSRKRKDRYVMTSIVLKQKQVDEIGRTRILPRLWQRNRSVNVVTFSLSRKGDLIGQIEQVAETIDADELVFYVELLARECDQFEYLLTGKDVQ